jgi:hypothetical protein
LSNWVSSLHFVLRLRQLLLQTPTVIHQEMAILLLIHIPIVRVMALIQTLIRILHRPALNLTLIQMVAMEITVVNMTGQHTCAQLWVFVSNIL